MDLGTRVASPMSPEAWEGVRELSGRLVETAGGRFRLMPDTAETLDARTSLYIPCLEFENSQVDAVAEGLEPNYPEMVKSMHDAGRGIITNKIAADLDEGKNVAVNMNHPSLVRSGIGFRLICRALEDKGVEFDRAIIGGAAIVNLEVKLGTDDGAGFMPAYDAMGLVSDHFFVSVPDTERASQVREKHKKEVSLHNTQMKEKLKELLDGKDGVLLLMLGSGTHDRPATDRSDVIEMAPISDGTCEILMDRQNRLSVVQAAVADIPNKPMEFYLLSGPNKLFSIKQMHREMGRTARFLTLNTLDFIYNYQGLTPRKNIS